MLTAQAQVRTERPSRYLVQLCRHAGQMRSHLGRFQTAHADADAGPEVTHVEWSDTHGTVELNWGRWTLEATCDTLTLRAEATNEHNLRRIQDLLSARLEQIGRRDQLTVTWQPVETPTRTPPEQPRRMRHLSHTARWPLVAVGALLVTVHIGFGGAAFMASAWTAGALVAVLGLKMIGLRLFLRRRTKAAQPATRKRT